MDIPDLVEPGKEKNKKWANAKAVAHQHLSTPAKEQKLKEYFVSDFNAFVDYASMDKSSLDYLEIVIPVQALDHFRIGPEFSNGLPCLYVHYAEGDQLCVSGFNTDGQYYSFLGDKFQLNDNETCELIEHFVFETQWQKIFKLNGNETFKFKFHFQQCGQNHHVVLGGQMFSFLFFQLDLRRLGQIQKIFSCMAASECAHYQDGVQEKYHIPHFSSTAKERVNMLRNTGIKFNFQFYISNHFSFRPNYFQNNKNNFDEELYLNFENYPYQYTSEECDISQNFDFQKQFHNLDEEYQNLDLDQKYFLEEYDGFEQNSFFRENIFEEENFIVEFPEETNFQIFTKYSSPYILAFFLKIN